MEGYRGSDALDQPSERPGSISLHTTVGQADGATGEPWGADLGRLGL